MTIEVLERGTPRSEHVYTVRCMHCKSVLRFKEADATYVDDRNVTLLEVRCPVCKGSVHATMRR